MSGARGSRRSPSLAAGTVLITLVVGMALLSYAWTPHDPFLVDHAHRLLGTNGQYWLGTDKFGRDVFSRLLVGARTTLFVGVVAVGVAAVIGTPLGLVAGMSRGWVSGLVMRANDLVLAFPALLLAIMLGAVFGGSTTTAMVAIGLASVPAFARIVRSGTVQVMSATYVLAARSAGRRPLGIGLRHVLPNIAGLVIVQASVSFAIAILAEAGLAFLGFGTAPPVPSWGRMLNESQELLPTHPMLAVWPGVAIAIAVVGFNLAGDGLRDRYDPRLISRSAQDPRRISAAAGAEPPESPGVASSEVSTGSEVSAGSEVSTHICGDSVLAVDSLQVRTGATTLVHGIDLSVGPGERLGIVGESGSGKSITALAIAGLLPEGLSASGSVRLAGVGSGLLDLGERALSRIRGRRIGMVFQEPLTALNPVRRVGDQVAEALRIHRVRRGRRACREAAIDMLAQVQLPDPRSTARAYPHQLSGGQRQRVMIAMALACDPDVVICDEPTSALDVTVQAQILELVRAGVAEREAGLIFITHDLPVVAQVCDRVLVLRNGRVVEAGPVEQVLARPVHPYTRSLVEASVLAPATPCRTVDTNPTRPVIEVRDLHRNFRRSRASLRSPGTRIAALDGVSLTVQPGQRLGLVGESGSGKSTLVRLMAGLDRPTTGSIRFDGKQISDLPERRLGFLRSSVQMVFQDPAGSLDPRMRVADIVAEPLVVQGAADPRPRVAELLHAVGLPEDAGERYPHQFSGGQRQRISIARALAPRPRVLIADEPVSALDAPIRAQILDLLADLVDRFDLTLVLVSHDLTVVRHVCDRVAVLRNGVIVEQGAAGQVYADPRHPYTRDLLAAVPGLASPDVGATGSTP